MSTSTAAVAPMDDFNLRASRAPKVGLHRKSKSLAGFDPLDVVADLGLNENNNTTTNHDNSNSNEQQIKEEEDEDNETPAPLEKVDEADLHKELRAIASELGKSTTTIASPKPPVYSSSAVSSSSKPPEAGGGGGVTVTSTPQPQPHDEQTTTATAATNNDNNNDTTEENTATATFNKTSRSPIRHVRRNSRRQIGGVPSPAPPPQSPGKQRSLRWLGGGGGGGGGKQKDKINNNNNNSKKAEGKKAHSRTRSMPAMGFSFLNKNADKKSPARVKKPASHSRASSRASVSDNIGVNDMLQELWDLQEQTEANNKKKTNSTTSNSSSVGPTGQPLAIPTLAKPRPTSFLTGREVVLASEADATEWQLEIPVKREFTYTCRASSFLETYRASSEKEGSGASLDLNHLIGCTSGDLAAFVGGKPTIPATHRLGETHRPAVETLLECGTDLEQVQGYFRSLPINGDATNFREVFILERQRQFLCVFRGTMAEQQGKLEKQPDTIKLFDNANVTVLADRCKAFTELEPQLFGKLDQLMEDNPFCDFVFCGHGFGGAMATLAAYRYAWARPELRVAAMVTGHLKVGMPDFRLSANSLPNLKLVRVDLGNNPKVPNHANGGVHVGHTIRIQTVNKTALQVKAYKFSSDGGDAKADPPMRFGFHKNKEKQVAEYVDALDDLGDTWVKDFYREDGAGVKGTDNEARQMV